MPTIRMNREQMQGGYTVLPTKFSAPERMSYKARYLLAQMLSMSEACSTRWPAWPRSAAWDGTLSAPPWWSWRPWISGAQPKPRQWTLLPQRIHHPRSTGGGGSCPFGSRTPGAAQRRRPRNARCFRRSFHCPEICFCTVGGFSAAGFHAAGKPAAKKEQG